MILILKPTRMLKVDPACNPVSFMNILLRMAYMYIDTRMENPVYNLLSVKLHR